MCAFPLSMHFLAYACVSLCVFICVYAYIGYIVRGGQYSLGYIVRGTIYPRLYCPGGQYKGGQYILRHREIKH